MRVTAVFIHFFFGVLGSYSESDLVYSQAISAIDAQIFLKKYLKKCFFFLLEWTIAVAADWRHFGDGHVFIMSYPAHSHTNYYTTASQKIVLEVADSIRMFIDYIAHKFGLAPGTPEKKEWMRQIHGAGHSLGSHILGAYAHKTILEEHGAKIGVIYGLDSAGVMFTTRILKWRAEDFFGLNETHAHRVLILHTEWKDRGIKYALGHFDYYANGRTVQFGCDGKDQNAAPCSHFRATNLFKASMRPQAHADNKLIGFMCTYFGHVDKQKTSVFGIHHDFESSILVHGGIYYLPTGGCMPYNHITDKLNMKTPLFCKVIKENQNLFPWKPKIIMKYPEFTFEKIKLRN